MADVLTRSQRSAVMSRIRAKDTKPERRVRRALQVLAFRFRVHGRRLPGRPDVVLPEHSLIFEIRGCFWHGHKCSAAALPKTNRTFWKEKIDSNRRRDRRNERLLRAASSTGPAMLEILHTYEHDLQVCETYVKQLRTVAMVLLEAEAEVIARRDLRDMLAQTASDLGTLADRRHEVSKWTDLLTRSSD